MVGDKAFDLAFLTFSGVTIQNYLLDTEARCNRGMHIDGLLPGWEERPESPEDERYCNPETEEVRSASNRPQREPCTPDDLIAENDGKWGFRHSWRQAEDLFQKMPKDQILAGIDSFKMKMWICFKVGMQYRSEVARTDNEDLPFDFDELLNVKEARKTSGRFAWLKFGKSKSRNLVSLENYLDEKYERENIQFVESLLRDSGKAHETCPYVTAWEEAVALARYTDEEQIKVDPRVVQTNA